MSSEYPCVVWPQPSSHEDVEFPSLSTTSRESPLLSPPRSASTLMILELHGTTKDDEDSSTAGREPPDPRKGFNPTSLFNTAQQPHVHRAHLFAGPGVKN